MQVRCPYCGSTKQVKHGFSPSGTQKYICKSCGRNHMATLSRITYENKDKWNYCPNCFSHNVGPRGYNKSGTRRFYCKDCGTKYTPDQKTHGSPLSMQQKLKIKRYYFEGGLSMLRIAEQMSIDYNKVRRYINKVRQYNTWTVLRGID